MTVVYDPTLIILAVFVAVIGALMGVTVITQPDVWTFICGHQSALVLLKLT